MKKTLMLTGMFLIDAPASALNNAGLEAGITAENRVIVKKIRVGRSEFPYVSGQAVKRWWRETIYRKFRWNLSPITREEKVAYTAANPIDYEEDDVFGYMLAPKAGEEKGLVYRRIAPLKCTPLISLFENVITTDFGVFSRGELQKEPVPFEQEFYSTILRGAFSMMLSEVGVFSRGRARDIPHESDEKYLKEKKSKSMFQMKLQEFQKSIQTKKAQSVVVEDVDQLILPMPERRKRAR